MTNQTLANTVTRILRQPGITRMGFQLGGLLVTGTRYSLVARAIEEGKIECQVVDKFTSQGADALAKGMSIAAQYSADLNAMKFPNENYGSSDLGEERTIVHEATHAIFDLYATSKNTRTLAIEDESAAVLAEAFYIRLCDRPKGGFTLMAEGPQAEAWKLVNDIMIETDNFQAAPGTYFLKPEQTQDLRNAVAKDWNFTKYKGSDGLPTDARGTQYIYNGVVKCFSKWAAEK